MGGTRECVRLPRVFFSSTPAPYREIGILLPNNRRQHRTLHIQKDVLPYALCSLLCPVPAAVASIFRMDSISTSYRLPMDGRCVRGGLDLGRRW